MSRYLVILSVAALLAFAGCGGDDSTDSTGASGATGAADSSTATDATSSDDGTAVYDITIDEFVLVDEQQKTQILKAYAADNPDCDADVDRGFLLQVVGASSNVDQSSDLTDLLQTQC